MLPTFEHEVVANKILNRKFNLLTLKARGEFPFKIGQFVLVKVSKSVNRAYSVASSPATLPYWKIFVDVTPGGPGTTYLKKLRSGDIVQTSSPTGQFVLGQKAESYIFGATGCGIAPFIPMVDSLLSQNKQVHLFWGLRKNGEVCLKNTTSQWLKNSNFKLEIVLSQPDSRWTGKTGHINEFLVGRAKSLNKDRLKIYLSGSRSFIDEVSTLLKSNKIPVRKIFFEACY